jgi:NSS family neurotransmitter:Na+ symporter
MIELATRVLVDHGLARNRALLIVGGLGFLLGVPSAINLDFLGNQDFVWGVALMICGAFIAFLVIRFGVDRFSAEINDSEGRDWRVGIIWKTIIRWLVPVQAIALLVWWIGLAATVYAPDDWYNPLNPYSVMTCVVQWGAVLAVLIVLNRRLQRPWNLPGQSS